MSPIYAAYLLFFNDTATTEIYTLSLHDALPIWSFGIPRSLTGPATRGDAGTIEAHLDALAATAPGALAVYRALLERGVAVARSEEHTSELQSRQYLVCRLLLEKKNNYESSCIES